MIPALLFAALLSQTSDEQIGYGVSMIKADVVWSRGRGNGIRVMVIDTGIDRDHPELERADRIGLDLENDDDDPEEGSGHGTAVASVIAAARNGEGLIGVAPEAELIIVKRPAILDGAGLTRALDLAHERGARIVNMSFSMPYSDEASMALWRAYDRGILLIASAGNDPNAAPTFPASHAAVLAVGAVDGSSAIAAFSSRGSAIDLVAPAVSIFTAAPRGKGRAVVRTNDSTIAGFYYTGSSRLAVAAKIIDAGIGRSGDFPLAVRNNIAMVHRSSDVIPEQQALNAANAGAIAVIVVRSDDAALSIPKTPVGVTIPVIAMMRNGGEIAGRSSDAVSITPDDYTQWTGSSFAAAHVSGAAALLWSLAPEVDAHAIRVALLESAREAGTTGWDPLYGSGVLDVLAAAKRLKPALFPSRTRR